MSSDAMQKVVDVLLVIISIYSPVESPRVLSDLDPRVQSAFVYRAMGEARGDGFEAVSMVVGTMMCRLEEGYGTPEQVLDAYYAQDYLVDAGVIASLGDSACSGYKYALSASIDIPYLNIPEDEPRKCVGDTCFFKRWVDNRGENK